MIWKRTVLASFLFLSLSASAKTFQNSYVAFEVPEDWICLQEGVAWTCTPQNPIAAKEAVIVLAAKVAGPEDSLNNFLNFLKQPKKIVTRVGTPMPSAVMYAKDRVLSGNHWVESQHLGSEIQEFYTLYLATVKDQLAILISFSAEKDHFQKFNPVFDKAIKSLRITANKALLFPPGATGGKDVVGISGPQPVQNVDMMPPAEKKTMPLPKFLIPGLIFLGLVGGAFYFISRRRKKNSSRKSSKHKSK